MTIESFDASADLPDKQVLTVPDVARYLGIPRTAAYNACKDGTIPCARVGKHIRISRQNFLDWFRRQSS